MLISAQKLGCMLITLKGISYVPFCVASLTTRLEKSALRPSK